MGQGCVIPVPSNLINQGSFETPSSGPCYVAPGVTLDGGINAGCVNPLFASNGCIDNKAFFQPLSLYRSAKYRLSYYARNIEKTYGTLPASLLLNPGQIFQYAFGNLYYQMPLSITKTYTEDQVTHILTFQIEVTNNQNIIANNIVVTDLLANTLNLVNANGFTVNSNTLTQQVNLPALGSTTLSFTAQRKNNCSCTSIENCASAGLLGSSSTPVSSCITVPAIVAPPNGAITSYTQDPVDCFKINFVASTNNACDTHTWSFGDGTSGTEANPSHVYTSNGLYTVIHTVSNDCESASDRITVLIDCIPPFPCSCTEANTLNIDAGSGTNYSTLESLYNYDKDNDGDIDLNEHNGCIAIKGQLIIDQNISISDAEIKMQPCSEIIVRKVSGSTYPIFSLKDNNIHGCVKMWRGITVDNNCKLVLLGKTSKAQTIKDAEFAVTAAGGSDYLYNIIPTTVSIQYNSFELNHVGIYFPGVYGASINQIPLVNNTFGPMVYQNLLPSCTQNLGNYNPQISYAGIISKRIDLSLGVPTTSGFNNTFQNLRNGVIIEKATAALYNQRFLRIQGPANGSGYFAQGNLPTANNTIGIAILSNGGNITVKDSRFDICGHALYGVDNFVLKAQGNSIANVIVGIQAYAPIGLYLQDNNNMLCRNSAIIGKELFNSYFSGFVIKQNNGSIANVTGWDGIPSDLTLWAALKLENFGNNKLGTIARISNNNFNALGNPSSANPAFQKYGFDIKGTGNWTIDDNTFTNYSLSEPGFKLEKSDLNRFYSNHVTGGGGNYAGVSNSSGYFLNSCTSNLFCCNSATDTRYGHRFMMICDDTKMRHSDMSNHQYSVHCSGGYFGQQYDAGNLFNTASGIAFHDGGEQAIKLSQFRVLNNQTPNYPEVVTAPNQTSLFPWFITQGLAPTCDQESNGTNLICSAPSDLTSQTPRYLTDTDRIIAEKGFESENSVLQWEGERNLYADLKAHPDLLGTDHLIDSFYNREQSGAINAVYEVEQDLAKVRTVPSSYNATLISIRDSIDAKTIQINQRLSSLSTALTANDSANLYLQANRLLAERSVFSRNLISLQEQMKTERLLHINTSLAVVNSLEANNVYKQNFKTVSRIYLETIGQDNMTLSQSQFSAISAIAHQCIFEGGTAVLDARMLYQLHAIKYFSDDTLCQQIGQRAQNHILQKNENQDDLVFLVPNPANETVTIQGLHLGQNEVANVDLFDIKGNTIVQFNTTEDQPTLDLRNVANGVYLCRITKGSHALKPIKIVVIH